MIKIFPVSISFTLEHGLDSWNCSIVSSLRTHMCTTWDEICTFISRSWSIPNSHLFLRPMNSPQEPPRCRSSKPACVRSLPVTGPPPRCAPPGSHQMWGDAVWWSHRETPFTTFPRKDCCTTANSAANSVRARRLWRNCCSKSCCDVSSVCPR